MATVKPVISEEMLGLILVAVVLVVVVARWLWNIVIPPDPWDAETEAAMHELDAVPLCDRCLAPQPQSPGWFCPNCGAAVGQYNTMMPYLGIFSLGEVLRRGASGEFPVRTSTVVFFVLLGLAEYTIFAPAYWFRLYRNVRRLQEDD